MEGAASITLFGRFSVTVTPDGDPDGRGAATGDADTRSVGLDDFERRSGAELVQLLTLAPDRRMHRDQVLDALWPTAGLDQARNAFYKAATFARKVLGDDAIRLSGGTVILLPDHAIEADVDRVRAAPSTPWPPRAKP
ncbi:MAG: hypothetical protein AAGD35_11165 [Actinomycetota bacterium]